ncbi:MAG: hypothetical protein SGI84_08475 [Gemmatimonadota bacterium]|nr:hypothetical protein [Gemmatimonadota bacterium]
MSSPSAIQKQLQKLAKLSGGKHPIVSCYLKLEPRDRSGGKYRIKVKNRIRAAEQGLPRLGLDRHEQEAVLGDLARIQGYLDKVSNLPGAQGVAIFASAGHRLFETIPLPRVYRSRLAVDRTPQVGELAAIDEEMGTYLTAVLDRSSARIWEVSAFTTRSVAELAGSELRGKRFHASGTDSVRAGEHTWRGRIREEKQRHYAAIADKLFELDRANPMRGIVLAAPGVEAGAVEPFLHPYLAAKLMGTAKLSPKLAKGPEVHEATLLACEAHERQQEKDWVAELMEKEPTGWAVNGVGVTLRALALGKVRTLLVQPDATTPGFRCRDTGRLVLTERECRLEGGGDPVLDVIDDAIEEALRQRLTLDVVFDAESTAQVDGLAGLLRFK